MAYCPRARSSRAQRPTAWHVFALTDHDDVAGLSEAQAAAVEAGIDFIPGVEISVTWGGQTVHIVGLRIDPRHPMLAAGLEDIRSGRTERAHRMAADLAKSGIAGAFEGASSYAVNKHIIGRTHFARWLVGAGYAPDIRSAFKRFLTRGNPGYVEHEWTTLENAVNWIRASGGMAVVAHPGRYAFNARELHLLLDAFRALGGAGDRSGDRQPPSLRIRQVRRSGAGIRPHGLARNGFSCAGRGHRHRPASGPAALLPAGLARLAGNNTFTGGL